MYVGMPTLIATLTLQSATVTLSKEGTKAGAALGTLLTAAFWATPCTVVTPTFGVVRVFVEVNVASVDVLFGVVSIIEVLLKQ